MMLHDRVHSPLNSDRWNVVDRLFQQACDLAPDQRESFLASQCGGDDTLLTEVRSLLDAATRDERFLDWNLPAEAVGAVNQSERKREGDLVGRDVGNYRITRFIAAGGMGAVYEAQQKHPKRTVALKFLRAGWVTPSARQRFEQEAVALARMKHPAVAQIHDAGTVDDAMGPLLYFAMEFVTDAKTIIDFADARALTRAQRIELFALVCDAVHHGHQRGIIHRDLKPGNILVDGGGAPKVIDFGVAHLADGDAATPRITRTITPVIGTLAYMSPEQLQSDALDIDTRSDVYALGVVLYELLTGRLPHDVSGKPLSEVMRIIGEDSPAAPSAFDAAIDRDLDAIMLKSLQKQREHRYQSAAELAEDIRRWQRHEPVNAQPPAAMYHLRKWARRHRSVAAGAAIALVGLCAGLVGSLWYAAQAREAQHEAQQQATKANDAANAALNLTRTLLELVGVVDPSVSDRNFGRHVSDSPQGLLDLAREITERELAQHPVEQARLFESFSIVYANMGRLEDSTLMAERALALRRQHQGEDHPDIPRALHALAWTMHKRGEDVRALELELRAYQSSNDALGPAHEFTIKYAYNVRHFQYVLGQYAEAERTARHVIDVVEQHDLVEDVEGMYISLGEILRVQGRLDEAGEWFRRAYDGRMQRVGPDHVDTAAALYVFVHNEIDRGDAAALANLLETARSNYQQTQSLPANHPHRSGAALLLGELLMARGELDQAESLLRECVAIRAQSLPQNLRVHAYAQGMLGECLARAGRPEEARPLLTESLAVMEQAYGKRHVWAEDARRRLLLIDNVD